MKSNNAGLRKERPVRRSHRCLNLQLRMTADTAVFTVFQGGLDTPRRLKSDVKPVEDKTPATTGAKSSTKRPRKSNNKTIEDAKPATTGADSSTKRCRKPDTKAIEDAKPAITGADQPPGAGPGLFGEGGSSGSQPGRGRDTFTTKDNAAYNVEVLKSAQQRLEHIDGSSVKEFLQDHLFEATAPNVTQVATSKTAVTVLLAAVDGKPPNSLLDFEFSLLRRLTKEQLRLLRRGLVRLEEDSSIGIGTACSGSDGPVGVVEDLCTLANSMGLISKRFQCSFLFNCENHVGKRTWAYKEHQPQQSFGDVEHLGRNIAPSISGEAAAIPRCTLFLCGFSCKSRSALNVHARSHANQNCVMTGAGQTGGTWKGIQRYIEKHKPRAVVQVPQL